MSHRSISLLAATVAAVVMAAPTAAAGWTSPVEIYDGNYSEPSLAVDAHGHAHVVARGDTGVWYLTNKSGTWKRTRLTTDHVEYGNLVRSFHPVIAIDRSRGKIVVAYLTFIADACVPECLPLITYVHTTGVDWSAPIAVSTFYPSSRLSIAAGNGDIAMAGLGPEWPIGPKTQVLEYLHKADGWAPHRVAGGADYFSHIGAPSLALDTAGRPRMAFQRKDHVKYATGATTSGPFTIETVGRVTAFVVPSLALDPNDQPMIVWAAGKGTHFARLAGAWSNSMVMPGRYDARLVVDDSGTHVVSSDGDNGLWYGTGTTSANWTSQQVTDLGIDGLGGIGVGAGRVDIAYELGQDSPRVWFAQKGS
jgi:hypothetical protein